VPGSSVRASPFAKLVAVLGDDRRYCFTELRREYAFERCDFGAIAIILGELLKQFECVGLAGPTSFPDAISPLNSLM